MDMLLAIKPKYADKIISGEKKVEFRKVMPQKFRNGDKVFIQKTGTLVSSYFFTAKIMEYHPDDLDVVWDIYKDVGGISEEEFYKYYRGAKKIIVFEIKKVKKLKEGIIFGSAPQSFRYVDIKIYQ